MKNITLKIDDDTYRKARVRAAERGTSVSAIVRTFLESLNEETETSEQQKRIISALHRASDRERPQRYDRRRVDGA